MNDDSDVDNNNSMDLIMSCKEFYIKRVRCLDEFRGTLTHLHKGGVQLKQITGDGSSFSRNTNTNNYNHTTLTEGLIQLKTDMMSLMENDILLTGKLISLSEAIAEAKRQRYNQTNCQLSSSSSLVSLNGADDELDSSPYHNVNRVTIDDFEDEDEDEILESVEIPRRDYFARQSSVLRIPIPPSRHRSRSYVECMEDTMVSGCSGNHKTLVDKEGGERIVYKRQSLPIFGAGHNKSSHHSVLHSPASDSGVSVDSAEGIISADDHVSTTKLSSRSHDSQNSFDSGIHLVSPTENKISVVV